MDRTSRCLAGLVVTCLLSAGAGSAQTPPVPDPFQRAGVLIGRWEGTAEGQPGKGTVRREYTRALNGRFIRVHNRSEYPAQEKNPKGEIHEDEGFIRLDRSLAFTTEAIENIPAGWRARETYVVHCPEEIEELFELADSGKPFEVYSRSRLKRLP